MEKGTSGHEIVLTSEAAIASDTLGSAQIGFISALPENILGDRLAKLFFNVESDKNGIVKRAPYGLAKVESKLREIGADAVIANPYQLDKVIGERTRVVGVYTMDGLGYSYGSGIVYWMIKLAGIPYTGLPYISRSFRSVLNTLNGMPNRNSFKIVVGGPATWQVSDSGMQRELGIDHLFEGEFETDGPKFFNDLLYGKEVSPRFVARPADMNSIPTIITPSNGGMVEVTRGCGRGCAFCSVNLSGMIKSFPFEGHIDKEILTNIEWGNSKEIGLHSEEYFRYGANGIDPRPEKVIDLTTRAYKLVKRYGDDYRISIDFSTAAVAVQHPELVRKVGEYVNEGGRKTFIEVGIETGSPRLIEKYMKGKFLPYRARDYPGIVEQGIGILNDNGWIVVGTMILNFPEESDDDIMANIELLDRLKHLNVVTFPLPLIPVATFRQKGFTALDEILDDSLRKEFVKKAIVKAFENVRGNVGILASGTRTVFERGSINLLGSVLLKMFRDRIANHHDHFYRQLELKRPVT
ncbi:MAG: B12-binding domain-containing radical SAM protein [Thermoplasmata archaeon]